MKTENLIAALAADRKKALSPRRALACALAGSVAAACVLFFLLLGPRPDFMPAMHTMRFDFKFVAAFALAASAAVAAMRLMRPESDKRLLVLLAAPALLLIAMALELIAVPAGEWGSRLIGHNAVLCMTFIPILSFAPLGLTLWALRHGATRTPALTGAVAGLVAGGIGALFYAAHCFDDSPLFVATWYGIAVAFMAGLGAALGSRLLRW